MSIDRAGTRRGSPNRAAGADCGAKNGAKQCSPALVRNQRLISRLDREGIYEAQVAGARLQVVSLDRRGDERRAAWIRSARESLITALVLIAFALIGGWLGGEVLP